MTDELKEAVDRLREHPTWQGQKVIIWKDVRTVLTALERETARADRAESALRHIVEMPDYDQDNEHRLRHIARTALEAQTK